MRFLLVSGVVVIAAIVACSSDDPASGGKGKAKTEAPPPPSAKKPGDPCTADAECESTCTNGKCAVPSVTDGKKSPSLGETDVDCGGTQAPKCALGKTCGADTDCTTSVCSGETKCVQYTSCRGTAGPEGAETCGQGEVGEANASHESCCTSALLPGSTTRSVDRYKITAGRIREWITAMTKLGGGDPNIRQWALDYAGANPDSQLGLLEKDFPGYLEAILPSTADNGADVPLAMHLGVSPVDAQNTLDGCYMGDGSYGHNTYWQDPATLRAWGVGYGDPVDGKRKFGREILDTKPMNCMMTVMYVAFCAWDGGELATPEDYRLIHGQAHQLVMTTDVSVPWKSILEFGQFNWENGHGGACAIPGWPGCVDHSADQQPYFYQWPQDGTDPGDDDSPTISPPGRFPLDVSAAVSSTDGRGWYDVAGVMMETTLPKDPHNPAAPTGIICDMSGGGDQSAAPCTRTVPKPGGAPGETEDRPGVTRYTGPVPASATFGYSFEGHSDSGGAYLFNPTDDPTKLPYSGTHFQYGKIAGRCARTIE